MSGEPTKLSTSTVSGKVAQPDLHQYSLRDCPGGNFLFDWQESGRYRLGDGTVKRLHFLAHLSAPSRDHPIAERVSEDLYLKSWTPDTVVLLGSFGCARLNIAGGTGLLPAVCRFEPP
jgi:hypothetical protein